MIKKIWTEKFEFWIWISILNLKFEFKLCDYGTVDSAENVFCMICNKSFAYHGSYTSLVYHLQRAHSMQLTTIND